MILSKRIVEVQCDLLYFVGPEGCSICDGMQRQGIFQMTVVRIKVSRTDGHKVSTVMRDIAVEIESPKKVTKARAARILARTCPEFRRRRGRASIGAGVEILPVLEETQSGWRAWRLCTDDGQPSGFEPPLKGRVGKANSRDRPYADRSKGKWETADLSVVTDSGPENDCCA